MPQFLAVFLTLAAVHLSRIYYVDYKGVLPFHYKYMELWDGRWRGHPWWRQGWIEYARYFGYGFGWRVPLTTLHLRLTTAATTTTTATTRHLGALLARY